MDMNKTRRSFTVKVYKVGVGVWVKDTIRRSSGEAILQRTFGTGEQALESLRNMNYRRWPTKG